MTPRTDTLGRLKRALADPRLLASGLMRRLSATTSLRLNYSLRSGSVDFRIPVIGGVGTAHLVSYEPWLDSVLPILLNAAPNALFVDVGANIGQTLLKVRSIDPSRRYVALEPNPNCVFYLRELIRANRCLSDVVLYPVGLSSRTCILNLVVENPTDPEGTVIPDFRKGDEQKSRLPVAVFHPDELGFSDEASLVFKIDVEGGELEVLSGIEALVRRTRCALICEVLPPYTTANELRINRQELVEAKLSEWDYDIIRVSNAQPPHLVSEFGVHGNLDWTNYVFLPRENSQTRQDVLKLRAPTY